MGVNDHARVAFPVQPVLGMTAPNVVLDRLLEPGDDIIDHAGSLGWGQSGRAGHPVDEFGLAHRVIPPSCPQIQIPARYRAGIWSSPPGRWRVSARQGTTPGPETRDDFKTAVPPRPPLCAGRLNPRRWPMVSSVGE
jgi:hypothetical protein